MNSIIIFDGECVLCNRSVAFIIRNDRKGSFRFAHSKSETIYHLLQSQGGFAPNESLILIEGEKIYKESDAALRIARKLRQPWPAFYIFIIIPGFLRNFLYRFIARNRYSVFGKCASCMVMNDENKHLFLP